MAEIWSDPACLPCYGKSFEAHSWRRGAPERSGADPFPQKGIRSYGVSIAGYSRVRLRVSLGSSPNSWR